MLETSILEWILLVIISLQYPVLMLFVPITIFLLVRQWYESASIQSLWKVIGLFYGLVLLPIVLLILGAISLISWLNQFADKL